ncbi:signal peptidase I [Paenibacillus tritici]|uniref:Signal peptidase I n=1 Tax=Paenibacillus tritici TaxID=1873425 RepID=A0ABX2DXE4_9BACL|nr:signal peptidase I [Paenibacillus tritici]NQX48814.1 signal peptidase I [Paenibacillus tritici]QUL55562.1 signal peptidase I [Paenibacillus tritici]
MNRELEEELMRSRRQRYRSVTHNKSRQSKRTWIRDIREWIITAGIVFAVMSLLNIYVFNVSTVIGQSMQPTLYQGEKLIINKIALSFGNPGRGEIVVLHDPSTGPDRKEYLVKRVIGIPGDIVEVRDQQLYVNGKRVEEPYIDTSIEDPDFSGLTVQEGTYFVMGDNRHAGASKDSRYFGPVAKDSIVGKVSLIWWPISKMKAL